MPGTHINGHDAGPGTWHPQDVASAWVYPSTDEAERTRADGAPGTDVPPDGQAGEGDDAAAPSIVPIEDIIVPATRAPLVGRVTPDPGSLTLLYGEPAAGKSYTALGWAQGVIAGGGRVLVMDYETDAQAWVTRSKDIGLAPGLFYVDPMGIPLTDRASWGPWTAEGFAMVIVDSVLMSLGAMGESEWSPSNPIEFRHAIEDWPCPVLGLAHQGPKSSGGGVFGSKYWTALAGRVWHETDDPADGRRIRLVKNRYGPQGERHQVHLHHHEDGPVYAIAESPIHEETPVL